MTGVPRSDRLTRRGLLGAAGAGAAGALALGYGVRGAAPAAAATESGFSDRDVAALEKRLESRFAKNGDVRIHYEIAGEGPLILFIHGFPGWWWTWRHPMAAFAGTNTVAAMDLRGYNLSDKPEGVANYGIGALLGDVRAVIEDTGFKRATIVAHDFGGGIAWVFAIAMGELLDRLAILNSMHPWSLARVLYEDPAQAAASAYAQEFRRPDALQRPLPALIKAGLGPGYDRIDARALAALLAKPPSPDYPRHLKAMKRTSIQGALNYYVANYPGEPYGPPGPRPARVKAKTLVIHGRDDPALLVDGMNYTWDLVKPSLDLRVIAGAGHFVLDDARAEVIGALREWLTRTA